MYNKEHKRCLFFVSKIDIIWSDQRTPEFNFEQVIKSFLVRNISLFWFIALFTDEWLYVIIMARTRFSVNLHSIVAQMSRNFLLETGAICKF